MKPLLENGDLCGFFLFFSILSPPNLILFLFKLIFDLGMGVVLRLNFIFCELLLLLPFSLLFGVIARLKFILLVRFKGE